MKRPSNAPSKIQSSKPAGKRLWTRIAKAFRKGGNKSAKPVARKEKNWRSLLTGEAEKECPAAAFRQLSEELRLAGDFVQANAICSRGVALYPDHLWLTLIHAKIAESMDDPVLRQNRWRRVIELGGDQAPARAFKNLADCLQARGDFPEAEAVVRQGMVLFPEDANLEERLARISCAAGFTAKAIHLWNELIAHHPEIQSAWVYRRISEALCSEGLPDRAVTALEEGLAKYPEDERLKEALGRLVSRRSVPTTVTESGVDFTAHLLQARAEPFGRGTCTLPFALNEINQHVPAMLDFAECITPFRDTLRAAEVDVFTTWGAATYHPHDFAIRLAKAHGKPHLSLESGFIGSLGPAINPSPLHSIIVCPGSIYFDSTRPSALENRLNSDDYQLDDGQRARAEQCIAEIVRHRITQDKHAPRIDLRGRFPDNGTKRVLVVDERFGDPLVDKGLGCGSTFERMWEAALALSDHEVLVKLHPDAISGGQGSYFGRIVPDPLPPNVTLVDFDVNPFCLFEVVDRVFVCTSQLGFQALMAGKEVDCFGVPFYAGWGLTHDRVVIPRRKRQRTMLEIFHLFYIEHSRYFVPGHGVAEIEDLIRHLVETRTAEEQVAESPAAAGEVADRVTSATEPLRILMIPTGGRFSPSGRYMQNLAWSLCRLGCQVQVLAEGKSPPLDSGVTWLPLEFEGARLAASVRETVVAFAPHIVYENGVRSRSQRTALEVMVLTGARLAMQSEDDDIQVYETHHGKEATKALTLVDKPVLTSQDIVRFLHRNHWKLSLNTLFDPEYDRWVEPLTRALCYRLASLHTVVWHPFAERLANEYGVSSLVVPPVASAADFDRLPPSPDERARILTRYGIEPDRVIIFIGGALYSFSAEYAIFLDACNRAAMKTGRAMALVVASGRSALPIAAMAREHLRPDIGFADIGLAGDDIYMEMLKACDVVCSPGLPDTFNRFRLPSRLVKAMAMAKPVLTCRCGFGESLENGVSAFLMDGSNPAEWADAIAMCMDDQKRAQIGEQGRIFARQHFDSDRVAAALKEKFETLMAAPPHSLADGIDLKTDTVTPYESAKLRAKSGIKLRSRYHSSMQDAIHHIAIQCDPLDTVVHIGAGRCEEFDDYCRMGAKRVLLVEASPGQAGRLKELEGFDGRIAVKQAAVSGTRGQQPAFLCKNTRKDSESIEEICLLKPSRLLKWKPAIQVMREEPVTTVTLSDICEEIPWHSPDNLLVLELNGMEAAVLETTPSGVLQRFQWVAMRLSDEPLYENGATRERVERIMEDAGFDRIAASRNFSELTVSSLFRRKSAIGLLMLRCLQEERQLKQAMAFFDAAGRHAGASRAQLSQDLWALWESGFKRDGYFVEFGALDGMTLSNTWLLEKTFGWTGIAAEPNPVHWEALQKNRNCHLSQHCVTERSGETVPFLVAANSEYSRLESVVPDDNHEEDGRRGDVMRILVPTLSLNDLLEQAGAPEDPDFLSIDTEGSEFLILDSLDFKRWRFRLIAVEHNHTQAESRIHELLTANGYVRRFETLSAFDGWYVRQDADIHS